MSTGIIILHSSIVTYVYMAIKFYNMMHVDQARPGPSIYRTLFEQYGFIPKEWKKKGGVVSEFTGRTIVHWDLELVGFFSILAIHRLVACTYLSVEETR